VFFDAVVLLLRVRLDAEATQRRNYLSASISVGLR